MDSVSNGESNDYRRCIIRIAYKDIRMDDSVRPDFDYFSAQLAQGYSMRYNNWWKPSNVNILWF